MPVIVTEAPVLPASGDKFVMTGPGTVKGNELLAIPPTVTITLPLLAVAGTLNWMLVLLQLETVAVTPFTVTVLWPCLDPKLIPEIVTTVPELPEAGDKVFMHGVDVESAKHRPLLFCPPTSTNTGPVTAPVGTCARKLVLLQLWTKMVPPTGPAEPLNHTLLSPTAAPKLLPPIVTVVPIAPDGGDMLLRLGAVFVADTVNNTPLLACPPTVTTMFPVVAPPGTGATIVVALQLVGMA